MSQLATNVETLKNRDFSRFAATPLTGSFGALISGIQVADAIDDDELFAELHQAWLDYQLLFFREQELNPEQHLALGARFGEIQKHLEENGFEVTGAEFTRIPNDLKDVTPEERETIDKMVELLEDDDDVQNVYTNMKPE